MSPTDDPSDDVLAQRIRRALALPDAPAHAVRAAIDLWPRQTKPSLADALREAARQLVAALSFDSWAGGAAMPAMRAGASDTRHLLFTAEGRDVDLRIARSPGGFALTGQVLGPDPSGVVELSPAGAPAGDAPRTARLDTLGEFHLDAVGAGTYQVRLRLSDVLITLPPIEVGERA